MAELSLELLGPFQATHNGLAITGLTSDRLRALLAYLAVEADRSHLRPSLAVFLWPEAGYQEACSSLRYALSRLRHALGDPGADAPYLIVSRDSLQFNRHSRHTLDVARFLQLAGSHDEADLKAAVALYRGPFLEGISSVDSPAFDEWLLLKREQFDRQMLLVLHRLCAINEQQGDYRQAQAYARRQMEFDPWYEGAHRQLMRALALDGQRGAALSHFHNCQTLLARDLGAEPEDQTIALFESIRAGRLDDAAGATPGDAGQEPLHTPADADPPLFVGRAQELATLHRLLDEALEGESRFVFITGSTGSGKTALLRQFAMRALEQHSNLVAVCGSCAPYAGAADICLPFSEILRQLSGDLEIARVQPIYHRVAESRLHEFAPAGLRALVEHGPSLIGPLVSGSALLAQAKTLDPWPGDADARTRWLNQVQELAKTGANRAQPRTRPAAFHPAHEPASQYSFSGALQVEAYTEAARLLTALAHQRPLLLFLDDLQWADADTVALLWHLGRRLGQSPILLVGAYRPGDLANEREATEAARARFVHPLEQAVGELQSSFREVRIDLDQGEAGGLANTVLDAIPHAFGDDFRSEFARQTGGNPLFACELLRDMQARGALVKDSKGKWVESESMTWTAAPLRLQAVVAKLTANLPAIWREILLAASVQGPVFDAEVVAAALDIDEALVIRLCSGALSRRFNLVQAVSVDRFPADRHAGRTRLSRYRFRAGLCQQSLYRSLDPVRRAELHEAIAQALETLYIRSGTEATYGHALQVALHYEAADMPVEATNRLLQIAQGQDAGDDAAEGLLWPYLGDCRPHAIPMQCVACERPRRAERNLAVPPFVQAQRDRSTPDETLSYCESLAGGNRDLGLLLLQACVSDALVRGEYALALDLNHELLRLARTAADHVRQAAAHWALAMISIQGGEPVLARRHLEEALQQRVRGLRCTTFRLASIDMTVHSLAQLAVTLWTLGYPKQAVARAHEALNLARQEDDVRTQIVALYIAGVVLPPLCYETAQARGLVKNLLVLADRENLPAYRLAAEAAQGYDQVVSGDPAKGIARMQRSLDLLESMDVARFTAPLFLNLADACLRIGDPERGLAALAAGESCAGQFGIGLFEPEILRLMGDLLLAQYAGEAAPMAQAYYERAIKSAAEKEALAWQLRAAMSLARLLHNQGESAEAYARLLPVYTTFTEGCDTPDLNEAGRLLARLESESAFG